MFSLLVHSYWNYNGSHANFAIQIVIHSFGLFYYLIFVQAQHSLLLTKQNIQSHTGLRRSFTVSTLDMYATDEIQSIFQCNLYDKIIHMYV